MDRWRDRDDPCALERLEVATEEVERSVRARILHEPVEIVVDRVLAIVWTDHIECSGSLLLELVLAERTLSPISHQLAKPFQPY